MEVRQILKIFFYFLVVNLFQNVSGYIVFWCRYFNNIREKFRFKIEVNFDLSVVYKFYIIKFDVKSEEVILVRFK